MTALNAASFARIVVAIETAAVEGVTEVVS